MNKKIISLLLAFVFLVGLVGCTQVSEPNIDLPDLVEGESQSQEIEELDEKGEYTSPQEVALYICIFDKLPANFITKKEAMNLGWESNKGNLWEVTDNKSIGGDKFGNREGLLPKSDGRVYYECDVNYEGGFRGAERIVYSNDGLIFYTNDHYESFEQLYDRRETLWRQSY